VAYAIVRSAELVGDRVAAVQTLLGAFQVPAQVRSKAAHLSPVTCDALIIIAHSGVVTIIVEGTQPLIGYYDFFSFYVPFVIIFCIVVKASSKC